MGVLLYGTGWRTRTVVTISAALAHRSGSGPVIVVQHAARALTTLDLYRASKAAGFGTDELISTKFSMAFRNDSWPMKIMRFRHDSLMLRTNLSAYALV